MAALPMAAIVMAGAVADAVSGSKTATDSKGDGGYGKEQNAAVDGGGKAKKMKRSRRKSLKKTKQRNRKRYGRKSRRRRRL
jgi:hypothetical protein